MARAQPITWRSAFSLPPRHRCTEHGRQTPTIASITAPSHGPWWFPAASHTWTAQDAAVTNETARECRRRRPREKELLLVPGMGPGARPHPGSAVTAWA